MPSSETATPPLAPLHRWGRSTTASLSGAYLSFPKEAAAALGLDKGDRVTILLDREVPGSIVLRKAESEDGLAFWSKEGDGKKSGRVYVAVKQLRVALGEQGFPGARRDHTGLAWTQTPGEPEIRITIPVEGGTQ
jgi:bifunctional DNA-binding transcriptional regulator/antitoxin component of YhaV-PrlF toxin-antitoxin module